MAIKNELTGRFVASVHPPKYNGGVYTGWREPIGWCAETFGADKLAVNNQWYQVNNGPGWAYISEGVFEFDREQDYTMFMLRWS